ncbi:MAG: glycosyltransferase [Deltaproteobacteria bacterium]|nr:glycosyltransferase [Deltaproteobacteria bacterium]
MSVLPFFSIIIPTYGRPEQLETCLRALHCLDYPHDRFEVIVVDDGGEVPLEARVGSFSPRLSLTLLRQTHAGPASARNTGAAHARGQFLAFTDDDCAPAPDWLRTLAARVAATPAAAVTGQTVNALSHNLYAAASQLFVSFWMTLLNANPNRSEFWITSNLAVPGDTFRALGGFNPTLPFAGGEDWELCLRWLAKGHQICYAPEVVVSHAHLLNLRTFWLQHFHYGRGRLRMQRLPGQYQRQPRKRSFLSASWQLLRYLGQHALIWQVPFLAVLIGVAQAASAAGVFWEKRQPN